MSINIPRYFGSQYLLPSIVKNCRIINPIKNIEIGNIFLFEKNFYDSIYLIEEEYSENIIHINSKISGYIFVNHIIEINNGDSIIGMNAVNSEMIIRNVFIKRDSFSVKEGSYSRYIRFIAKKIEFPQHK